MTVVLMHHILSAWAWYYSYSLSRSVQPNRDLCLPRTVSTNKKLYMLRVLYLRAQLSDLAHLWICFRCGYGNGILKFLWRKNNFRAQELFFSTAAGVSKPWFLQVVEGQGSQIFFVGDLAFPDITSFDRDPVHNEHHGALGTNKLHNAWLTWPALVLQTLGKNRKENTARACWHICV